MDGLIFDTETLYARALRDVTTAMGFEAFSEAVMRSTIGMSWPDTQTLFHDILPSGADVGGLLSNWTSRDDELAAQGLQTKPGVFELLNVLDELTIPRAVATSSKRATAHSHLASHDLLDRFDAIVAEEDCQRCKPDPEPYRRAARALRIAPEDCFALEDSRNGIYSAHAAGMAAIMIPDLIRPDAETQARCAYVLNSLFDVVSLLNAELASD